MIERQEHGLAVSDDDEPVHPDDVTGQYPWHPIPMLIGQVAMQPADGARPVACGGYRVEKKDDGTVLVFERVDSIEDATHTRYDSLEDEEIGFREIGWVGLDDDVWMDERSFISSDIWDGYR